MDYGLSFASSFDAVRQAQLAEEAGFSYIGFYDSPALEPDIWITIANAIQGTRRIQVGAEVLIPHLRHPMAQASAIATIEQLAPGRLYIGIGTGFTGRMAMGQRPLTWAYVRTFLGQVKALLAGEDAMLEGAVARMLHPPGFAPPRPIQVPFLVAANGPKGVEIARECGDGLIYGGDPANVPAGFPLLQMGSGGILLDQGETPSSPRVLEAAKMSFTLQYHLAYEGYFHPHLPIEQLPHGDDWLQLLNEIPVERRHLHVHDQHTVGLNPQDQAFLERHPDALAAHAAAVTVTPAQLRARFEQLAGLGATRITSSGFMFLDWERELPRYAKVLGL